MQRPLAMENRQPKIDTMKREMNYNREDITMFCLKCILALFPVFILILYTALFPFGYMDEEYPAWRYTKDSGEGKTGVPDRGSTLILGDSRAMADMVPLAMDETVYNLAAGGATSIEMYYVLRSLLKRDIVPENVIIMFAPFHYSYIDNYWTRSTYFHQLSFREAVSVYREGKKEEAEFSDDGEHGLSELVSTYLNFPDTYMPALLNSRFTARISINEEAYGRLLSERGHGLFGTEEGSSDLNYEANYTELKKDGDAILLCAYLEKLLKLCEKNGIRTVLVQAPMNEASYEKLSADYVGQFSELIDSFREIYPEAVMDPEIPCFPNALFGDASHLNEEGAGRYTEVFMEKYGDYLF